eukprot:TRINITY_DN61083_c0_g1_i1.p1 TRINITY_DN61083_c0_g1~~TRINITY_DN61083_c0_g1_i1.p1  ORF type:complete len:627 (+),score=302.97 TRINITY_DN61083_c0_g1_i1:90-1883(+)
MGDAEAEQREQATMQKKMRLLEGNRRSYAGDAKSHLQKQQDTVNALKKENEKLKEDLAQAAGLAGFNQKHQATVTTKQETLDMIQRKCDHEVRESRKAELLIDDLKSKIFSLRKGRAQMGGVNATQENHQMVDKQIRVLENRLDQALVKFNEALSYNKDLREQIDNLRRERVVFDGIYKKLEKELHEKKKQMAEIIEKSNLYYEERDAAGVELKHLRESAEKDIQQYEEHFKELDLMIEANKNLEKSIKNMRNQSSRAATAKSDDEDELASTRKRKEKGQKQEQEQEPEVRTVNYQEIVDQLKEATGIQDMEVLLQKFVKAEEQNFSMYNFVNELNDEIEREEKDIDKLRDVTSSSAADTTRLSVLKDLEDELSKAEGLAEGLNEKTVQAKEQLENLRSVIWDIFNKIGCSTDETTEALGTSECTESNMMVFLGMIEQRTNELLNSYQIAKASEIRSKAKMRDEERRAHREKRAADRAARREQGEDLPDDGEDDEEDDPGVTDDPSAEAHVGKARFIGAGPHCPMGSTNLAKVVEQKLPAAGDTFGNEYDGVDGEDERVFSQQELRQQTELRLARQQNRDDRGDRGKKKAKDKHRRQ